MNTLFIIQGVISVSMGLFSAYILSAGKKKELPVSIGFTIMVLVYLISGSLLICAGGIR